MLEKEKIESFRTRMEPTLRVVNRFAFSDAPFSPPDIHFSMGDASFYNPSGNEIELGLPGIVRMFDVDSEEDLFNAVEYVRGHEEQHRRSTQSDDYLAAIKMGVRETIKVLASTYEGKPVVIRSEAEEKYFLSKLSKDGLDLSDRYLFQEAAIIANSLEDGRIERIRSKKNPQFRDLRTIYRYRFWDTELEWPIESEIKKNPVAHLKVLENELLSLATCQVHAKGFVSSYDGTTLMKEASSFIGAVSRAISSGNTRGLVEPEKEICTILAPYLYEACLAASSDEKMKEALEKILADLIKGLVSVMPEGGGAKRGEEETDEGGTDTAFPESDLEVTLDDDTYDKLVENASASTGKGGIKIRREHPKKAESSAESSSASSDKKEEGKSGSPEKGAPLSDDPLMDMRDGGDMPMSADAGSADGAGVPSSTTTEAEKGPSSTTTSHTGSPSGSAADRTSSGKPSTAESRKESEKRIMEAMKEADDRSRSEASETIESVDAFHAHDRKAASKVPEQPDSEKPLSSDTVKKWFDGSLSEKRGSRGYGFMELKRAYTLTDNLSPVDQAKGKALRRKNEKYFRSLQVPSVTNLDSGRVDPSLIYSLGIGNVDIFRRDGKSRKLNACAYILVDNSGSMSRYKRQEACRAAAVIEEGFRGLMPFKIAAFDFDWSSRSIVHEVIKGWDEAQRKNCCWNFCLHGRRGQGNADGFDIRIASEELLRRPEEKKLLIVLSDGEPAEASVDYTSEQIDVARKNGIKVCGIYFEEGFTGESDTADVFKEMYKRDFVCVSPDKVAAELEKVFRTFSRR